VVPADAGNDAGDVADGAADGGGDAASLTDANLVDADPADASD
jgi:hypothetical protein